jgi:heme/copper-type cytochrome/quinol oxidase subunit 4
MKLPRNVLFSVWIVLTVAAYYLVLFTNFGNYYHGGTPMGAALVDAVVVLGAFSCWEVFRTEQPTPLRAVAASVGVPLVLVVLLILWYGLKRHLAV